MPNYAFDCDILLGAGNQICHLFWNDNRGDDGIGGRVEGLSPTKVQAYLKNADDYFKVAVRSLQLKTLYMLIGYLILMRCAFVYFH